MSTDEHQAVTGDLGGQCEDAGDEQPVRIGPLDDELPARIGTGGTRSPSP